jgi:hypothetical protein
MMYQQPQSSRQRTIYAGHIGRRIALTPDGWIELHGQRYPVAGTQAPWSTFASGLFGRKHTAQLEIRLASGQVLTWQQTDTGSGARLTQRMVVKFAAAVNSMTVVRRP